MGKRNKKPIQVRVHYPETEEGMAHLKKVQAEFVINTLINKVGENVTDQIFKRMKEKLDEKRNSKSK